MRRSLSITSVGLSMSAVLAVIYTLVMFASLMLVGLGTTRSWQASSLGIGLSTVAGFVIGLLAVGIVGFALALVFVSVYNALQRPVVGRSKTLPQASQLDRPTGRSWQVRLLAACLVLPVLTLIALRALASAGTFGATPGDAGTTIHGPGTRTQPVNMGSIINSAHRETEPSFTADGRTMYFILGGMAGSRMALIAAVANVIATAQLLAMLMIQMSVYSVVQQPEAALKAVWWGLGVGWDLYLGTGTILFALCMFGRRDLGVWFAVPGLLISSIFLIFNIVTFPNPPDTAGLVDLGPLVGLWYLVVYVRLGVSSVVLERQHRKSIASLEGSTDPN